MTWISDLLSGLGKPFRAVATFFYVLFHWQNISHDLDQYRRQIKDREEWAAAMLRNKDALHKIERELVRQEKEHLERELARRAETLKEFIEYFADMYARDITAVMFLTARLLAQEGPLTRNLLLGTIANGRVREMLEATIEVVPKEPTIPSSLGEMLGRLPPPPLQPPEEEPKQ